MEELVNSKVQNLTPHLESHLAAIVLSSDDAIISKTMEGNITYWNDGAERIFGYKSNEVIGKSINILVPLNVDHHADILNRYHKGDKLQHFETRRVTKIGDIIEVSITVSAIVNEKNKVIGFSTIARDISHKNNYIKYTRSLIEASLDPFVTISAEGKITDVNDASVKVTGVSRKKLIGTDFSNYFTDPEKAREGYKQVFNLGIVEDYPLTIKHVNGKFTDVLYNASVYKDEKKNVLGVFAAARDVTALKSAYKYARSLIEASLDPLITINGFGKITDVNHASVEVTGINRDRLIGTSFSDYFTEPEKAQEGYRLAFVKGFIADYPLTIRNVDGKLKDVLFNASVYKDDKGNVLGVLAAARDITAQKQLAKMEEAEREKEIIRMEQLEKFRKLTIGRELKMIELKKEIKELKKQLSQIE